jgi:transcriptional regulator GlxA family with amidase domain
MIKIARILPNTIKPHSVAVVVFDGVVPSDFTTPCEVFQRVHLDSGQPGYEVKVCGVTPTVKTDLFTLTLRFTLAPLRHANTIILPGVTDPNQEVPPPLVRAVRSAVERGIRVASVCTGVFVLAATGLLDGARATTHWLAAAELARRYPAIKVDPNVLYVDNGNLLTSAGAAAGLDLCLHIVRRDYGAAVAARVARASVMPLERAGGQAQFIQHKPPASGDGSLQPLLLWIEDNLCQDLQVSTLANRAAMSVRTLHRQFVEQTGSTPTNWVLQSRIRRAQHLLETTRLSVEHVSAEAGFGATATFRDQFHKRVGTSPYAYRRAFRVTDD